MYINEYINSYMEERGIKQSFLSQKTGISQDAISKILRNARGISAEEFIKICIALDIDPNVFRKNPHKEDV